MNSNHWAVIKPALLGAIIGAAALAIIGFSWANWHTSASATSLSDEKARHAVIGALAPICAHQFKNDADAAAQHVALMKVSSWSRGAFVEKGGWATLPGQKSATSGVAAACADMLDKMTF